MGLSCHAAAADPFLLQSGRGAGALVLSGMGLDVRLDFATPAGSRGACPLGWSSQHFAAALLGFLLEEKAAGSHQTSNQHIPHVGSWGIKALGSMCTAN